MPVWVDDPRFNLRYHVRHTALPATGRRTAAEASGGAHPLPAARPRQAALGALVHRGPLGRELRHVAEGPSLPERRRIGKRSSRRPARLGSRRRGPRAAPLDSPARPGAAVAGGERGLASGVVAAGRPARRAVGAPRARARARHRARCRRERERSRGRDLHGRVADAVQSRDRSAPPHRLDALRAARGQGGEAHLRRHPQRRRRCASSPAPWGASWKAAASASRA